jgi:Mg-chelatase subunit ChlD
MPLFAVVLPLLLLLCAIAVNVAYFRMLKSEMKIATDATAHATGRAMSIYQDADQAIAFAHYVAGLNTVASDPFSIADEDITFGKSIRAANGQGRYQFTDMPLGQVQAQAARPNSVAIDSRLTAPLLIQAIGRIRSLDIADRSIATQVDRDIALVLDRSGSMLDYRDEDGLNAEIRRLRQNGLITRSESSSAINDDNFSANVVTLLSGDMQAYASDRRNNSSQLPRFCRWHYLIEGVDAFLDVLDDTPQQEYVTLATFSTSASLNYNLSLNYQQLRDFVREVQPSGYTAIGQGIEAAVPEVMSGLLARPFAHKTVVILTDGINNRDPKPRDVAEGLVEQYDVSIHTVTLSTGADQSAMEDVAVMGNGHHYHSDSGEELAEIFEEIANNLPTILTQ